MHLVVGLGNPGAAYARNRHNVGFMVVDRLAEAAGASFREKWKGRFTKARVAGGEVVLLEPLTFMNRSGESVQAAMRFFGVPLSEVLVVHDELDLPFGTLRLKRGGGVAGHNGLRSIVQHCGGPDFLRARIGIGRPPHGSPEGWVLGDFDADQGAALPSVLDDAARAVEAVIAEGISAAMNAVNARRPD
jgi:PTH1 family peptidyl-tRNA hydrolase